MRSKLKRIRGFALVSAIFILVVLAALGAFIMSISTSQQIGSALDVQGVRAYQAARAGLEWGLFQQRQTIPASCASAPTSFVPSTATTLSSFTVTVTCSASVPTCGAFVVSSGSFSAGYAYRIQTVGTTDFTAIGSTNNSVGTAFTARGVGAGTGTAVACEPIVYSILSTACSQPNGAEPKCPNTTTPGNLYIERRLSVTF